MSETPSRAPAFDPDAWMPALTELGDRIRDAVREAVRVARTRSAAAPLYRGVRQGAGDVTFGIDVPAEAAADAWAEEHATRAPLSLLTEERGWRHLGPDGRGGWSELQGFDHGGPRITLDPIDGTRGLMFDMRSAWTVAALAGPGPTQPRLSDVSLGLLAELPDSRARIARRLTARAGGGCRRVQLDLDHGGALEAAPLGGPGAGPALSAGSDDRLDHGFLPFFKYSPGQRAAITELERRFLERIAREEGADLSTLWDDQYLSNAGQLALLMEGTYRMIADLRAHVPCSGSLLTTSKPYDTAGAVLCAREAGCVVEDAEGAPLDYPLDVTTPVSFVGYVNAATRARLRPHLLASLS